MRLLDRLTAGELLVFLDQLADGKLVRSFDRINGVEVLRALENSKQHQSGRIKRTGLDTMSGVTLGEAKKRRLVL